MEKYKAIYFFTKKVACTSLKTVCAGLLGIGLEGKNVHFDVQFPLAERSEINKKYKDYFKFCFVRNPWDRLVSCFVDKIRDKDLNKGIFKNGIATAIFGRYEPSLFYSGMS